jgi:flagellin
MSLISSPSSFGNLGVLNTNISALNALNQLNAVNRELALHQLRLGTGSQQPRMEDGPSFFALQNKMRNQVRGKAMALDNIGDAKDMLSLAETGLLQIDNFLGQMRDLVVRAKNETLTSEQRDDVNRELSRLLWAIDQIADTTQFNESDALLDGGFNVLFQVGPNEDDVEQIQLGDFNVNALGIKLEDTNVQDADSANEALARIDFAINSVKDQLIDLGGIQRKLTALSDILGASMALEESQASRFGDSDAVAEQTEITRLQLLQQLAAASLSAANAQPQTILSLLLGQ